MDEIQPAQASPSGTQTESEKRGSAFNKAGIDAQRTINGAFSSSVSAQDKAQAISYIIRNSADITNNGAHNAVTNHSSQLAVGWDPVHVSNPAIEKINDGLRTLETVRSAYEGADAGAPAFSKSLELLINEEFKPQADRAPERADVAASASPANDGLTAAISAITDRLDNNPGAAWASQMLGGLRQAVRQLDAHDDAQSQRSDASTVAPPEQTGPGSGRHLASSLNDLQVAMAPLMPQDGLAGRLDLTSGAAPVISAEGQVTIDEAKPKIVGNINKFRNDLMEPNGEYDPRELADTVNAINATRHETAQKTGLAAGRAATGDDVLKAVERMAAFDKSASAYVVENRDPAMGNVPDGAIGDELRTAMGNKIRALNDHTANSAEGVRARKVFEKSLNDADHTITTWENHSVGAGKSIAVISNVHHNLDGANEHSTSIVETTLLKTQYQRLNDGLSEGVVKSIAYTNHNERASRSSERSATEPGAPVHEVPEPVVPAPPPHYYRDGVLPPEIAKAPDRHLDPKAYAQFESLVVAAHEQLKLREMQVNTPHLVKAESAFELMAQDSREQDSREDTAKEGSKERTPAGSSKRPRESDSSGSESNAPKVARTGATPDRAQPSSREPAPRQPAARQPAAHDARPPSRGLDERGHQSRGR
jgi:hypothetical protein